MHRKTYYNLELVYVKYSPMIIGMAIMLNSVLNYLNINCGHVLCYICGASLFTIGHLYVSSYSFKFCSYHRLFIHYVVIGNLLQFIDYFIGVPLSNKGLFLLNIGIFTVFLFLILYKRNYKHHAKNNQKTFIENY